ncbi:SDR family NAD(P)-dependent oxidoreductase [Variovorax terrae]|uniref:SDR family oxidoreductase n=1 Tax=Variovorax terrae TaxID=2923278 RepID=A0A9X2APS7_9BURK|nr:SDR family NAD(P)-dependent oxidoreductase [Variovorax terrae]MCJ0762366.1 SDR family oxidoreductase [Variovorax terrae]
MNTELDYFALTGKNIVVTGAAQGVGLALSQAIVALGGRVVAVDVQEGPLQKLASESNGQIVAATGDVRDPAFAAHVVEQGAAAFGHVDGLVNNAAIVRPAMIEKMTSEQWQQVVDVNLTGPFNFLQAVGRHLVSRRRADATVTGSIVNISSDGGRRGSVGQINYSATKAGMLGITMSAAREWGRHGIRVNTVCFGVVETQMSEVARGDKFADAYMKQILLERWASPQEVSRPVCFLLGNASSYITGQHLSVAGGFHLSA